VNPLSLHHLTALDASPLELIDIAAQTGCEQVCLFVYSSAPQLNFPVVAARQVDDIRARLSSAGVEVYNLEFFPIGPDVDVDAYDRALRVGAAIGGRRATVHIHDSDEGRALRAFERFCGLAAGHGLEVGLEFTAFAHVSTLEAAVAFIEKADQPNAAVAVDVLHLIRNGGDPARLARIDPDRIGYMQICDGPLAIAADEMMNEAVGERAVPGQGAFPLPAFLRCAPAGVTIDVEVPQRSARLAGVNALDRARRAVTATRKLMDTVAEGAP
jgi:sugar phosphate isomerase/epimerase